MTWTTIFLNVFFSPSTALMSNFFGSQFVLPFLANQCGSILFYLTLSSTGKSLFAAILKVRNVSLFVFWLNRIELSIAVPLTNGLTFLFTSMAGQLLGEHAVSISIQPITESFIISLSCRKGKKQE